MQIIATANPTPRIDIRCEKAISCLFDLFAARRRGPGGRDVRPKT